MKTVSRAARKTARQRARVGGSGVCGCGKWALKGLEEQCLGRGQEILDLKM